MLALAAPETAGLDLSFGRINAFISRDQSEGKKRSALLVAGLAGLGRIDARTADRLNRRHGLAIGHLNRWTRMIDGSAALGQAGSVLVMTATGFQATGFEKLPSSHLYHAVAALEPDRTGLHREDDRRRGARPHVTDDDRALVDRFLDMMAAEAGRFPAHAVRLPQRHQPRGGGCRRIARHGRRGKLSRLGEQWADLSPATVARRSAALRRFFGFLMDEGFRNDDPSARAAPAPARAAIAANSRRTRSRPDLRGGRGSGVERGASCGPQSCHPRVALRFGACARASWSRLGAAHCARGSRS